ncbi:MAG: hypothetical protein ACOCP8_02410 [archaeon]
MLENIETSNIMSMLTTGLTGFLVGYIIVKSIKLIIAIIALLIILVFEGSLNLGYKEIISIGKEYGSNIVNTVDGSIISALSIKSVPFIAGFVIGFFYGKE